jgi:uncharacterized membrane protein
MLLKGPQYLRDFLYSNKFERIYNVFIFALVLFVVGQWFIKYANILLNTYNNIIIRAPYDVSEITQALWNTSKGRFFEVTGCRVPIEAILIQKNFNVLISHWHVIFLFFSLFYVILPHTASFIISQCLCIGISGTVVYLMAREVLTEKRLLPILIFFVYSQYYVVTSIAYFLHPESFCVPFLFLALYFYIKDNFKLMVLFFAISILCREEISLLVALLGLSSFFIAKRRKYSLFLFLLGILSFLIIKIIVGVLYTHYKEINSYDQIKMHYGYLGTSFFDKIKNLFVNPSLIIQNISQPQKRMLLKDVFGPLSYLPFLSPLYLFPGMLIFVGLVLSQTSTLGVLDVQPWYYCMMLPFVFLALIGAVEKIYNVEDFIKSKLFKNKFIIKIIKCRIIKIASVILIFLLLFNIYAKNIKLTKLKNNPFQEFFAIEKYWIKDTFEVISAIKEEARVVCSARLMPMLSMRRHILEFDRLTKEVIEKGIYDIVLISEDDLSIREPSDNYKVRYLDTYNILINAPNYKRIYSTPFLKVFVKDSTSSSIFSNWKFDLSSKIKTSSISSDYIFSDFVDYSTILENAGVLDPSGLVEEIHKNTQIHYATLEPKKQLAEDILYFVSDKPLEIGYGYVLVLSAQSLKGSGVIRIHKSVDDPNKVTEISIDNNFRIYAFPFTVTKPLQFCELFLGFDQDCNIKKPVLLRFSLENLKDITNSSIFEMYVNSYKFSYNPWIASAKFEDKNMQDYQFLEKEINYTNPLVFFMKLFNLSIPLDLYRYSWESDYQISSELVAVKY